MSTKRFSDRPTGVKQVDFEIDFWKSGQPIPHSFNAYPTVDAFALATINKLAASDRTAIDALNKVKNYIRTMLDDNDGTPLEWVADRLPDEVQVPAAELVTWPTETDEEPRAAFFGGLDEGSDVEPQFLAPDGTVHPWRDAEKYDAFEAGSSRRRWVELMDGDNDLTVEAKTIMKLWQWLVSESAERPTVR